MVFLPCQPSCLLPQVAKQVSHSVLPDLELAVDEQERCEKNRAPFERYFVDGSEIRLSPVDLVKIFHYLYTWFYISVRWCMISAINCFL